MTAEGGVQYSKIAEIKGPLVVVDDVVYLLLQCHGLTANIITFPASSKKLLSCKRSACTKAAMWSPTRHLGHKKFHPPSSCPTCIHSYPASGFQFRVYHLSSGAGISIQSVGFFDRSALIHSLCKCNKPGQFGANNRQ